MNAPLKKFSSGSVSATVWENVIPKDGKQITTHNVTIERSYTKDEGKTWEKTNSMNQNDLPKLALVTNKAFEFITLKEMNGNA